MAVHAVDAHIPGMPIVGKLNGLLDNGGRVGGIGGRNADNPQDSKEKQGC